ncbi:MAG: hypothetical protein U1F71_24370 [Verrucomicrobiaceae bacterium]
MNALYSDACVRQRLIEFLGGDTLEHATAVYVTHSDRCCFDRRELRPPSELNWLLDRDLDIARSLADAQSCLLHLDVEYVNFDAPAEAFVDPWRCFELQEPVVREIERLLLGWGIRPLHLITGQGHHFIWRIDRKGGVASRIAALAPAPELSRQCLAKMPSILTGHVGMADLEIFSAVALLAEFVAHRIKETAAAHCVLPVEVTAVHVGPCATSQREMISIDISEYGDPLQTRMIRMPFTIYRKPWVSGLVHRLHLEDEIPPLHCIPLHEMDFRQALKVRQDDGDVMDLARRACVRVPLQETGTEHLIEEYLASRLCRFHQYYYSTRHDPPERWAETYGHTPLALLPGCVRHLLQSPNDLLLKPAGMQLVTRCMLAQGWHPRHIAGLIRSKFEDPAHGWGVRWEDYEAGTRADFYTRLFAGLYLAGPDRLQDFNCTSTREKGFCFPPNEGSCELETARQQLLSQLPS